MALTGKTQVANINSFYDRVFLERLLPLLTYASFGQSRNVPKNNSGVIKFRKYNALTVATTPLTEGTTPTGSQLSVTDSNATVLQYGDYVTLSDKLQMETEDPIETEAVSVLAEQAAKTFDELCRDVLVAGTTIQYASTATARDEVAATMTLKLAEVNEAVDTLKSNNAKKITGMVNAQVGYNTTPIDACYVGITSIAGARNVKDDTAFVSIEKYVGGLKNGAMPGEFGKLGEVRFIESTQGKVFEDAGASSIDVHGTLILGANAYGISQINGEAMKTIRKQLGSGGSADPLDQRSSIGWKGTFVAKILDQTSIVRIEHAIA